MVLEQNTFQPRKTCPCLTEILLMVCKGSNQTDEQIFYSFIGKLQVFIFEFRKFRILSLIFLQFYLMTLWKYFYSAFCLVFDHEHFS